MSAPILKFGGGTSSIELYPDYIIIRPSNIQKLGGFTQTIPLDSVVTVSIVSHFLATPYLQIVTPGMAPQKNDATKGASANVVLIQPGNMKKAKQVQEYVAQYKARSSQRTSASSTMDGLDALEKLAELRKRGIISQAEFDAKKKQILGL